MQPKYNLDKIKFATDSLTFERAVNLYENGKITNFKEELNGYFSTVVGTKPYKVYVDNRYYDRGDCECYLGKNNTLCKHMVAVAIYAVLNGKKLNNKDKEATSNPICSNRLGELSKDELTDRKKLISSAMKYIKAYSGPSRIWFQYQNSLNEGCCRLSAIVSELPVSEQTAKLLIAMLLRLDKKLSYGVDDSDGTVGEFITEVVNLLQEYAKLDSRCIKAFKKFYGQSTCFGWEEPLVKMFDER